MSQLFDELRAGLLTSEDAVRLVVRLTAAMLAGAIAGFDRERIGKAAGLRTHMLVAGGSALFVLTPEVAGLAAETGRVIQGIAAGIGFIGGGAILKSAANQEIRGLTTAAGIWMTAAAGVAAGLGHTLLALIAAVMVFLVLNVVARAEQAMGTGDSNKA